MRAQGGGIAPGPRAACAGEARGGIAPAGLFRVLGEVAASRAARSALRRIRPPPGIVGRAGTAGGSLCGPLRVLGHCPAGRSDEGVFPLPDGSADGGACATFADRGAGGPPGGASLPDRSCARHAQEDLRGTLAGFRGVTWSNNLTAVARFALSRHSAVSKRFCTGRPPLWCRRYVPRVSEVRGGICSFDLIMSMLLLACVVGSAIVAFGDTLFGERFR